MATTEQILDVRRWVGDENDVTDATITTWVDRFSNTDEAALAILETRLGTLLSSPSVWSASGDYSENWTATIDALRARIAELRNTVDGAKIANGEPLGEAAVGCLTRSDRADLWRDTATTEYR